LPWLADLVVSNPKREARQKGERTFAIAIQTDEMNTLSLEFDKID